MAVEVERLVVAALAVAAAAVLASEAARRFRLPEAALLVLLGVLLGPGLGLLEPGLLGVLLPPAALLALIMLLADAGPSLRLRSVRARPGSGAGAALALLVFAATALLATGIGIFVAKLEAPVATLLGLSCGGAGASVAAPAIRRLRVRRETSHVLAQEAGCADLLVVASVATMAAALAAVSAPFVQMEGFALALGAGLLAGAVAGWAHARWAPAALRRGPAAFVALVALGAAVEAAGSSGLLAACAAVLVAANATGAGADRSPSPASAHAGRARWSVAGLEPAARTSLRAFVLVGLGAWTPLPALLDPGVLTVGALVAGAVAFGRSWGVMLLFWRHGIQEWDRAAMATLFPLGLAAAALSVLPATRFGLAAATDFPAYAAVALVVTNVLAAVVTWALTRPSVRRRFEGHPVSPGRSRRRPRRSPGVPAPAVAAAASPPGQPPA